MHIYKIYPTERRDKGITETFTIATTTGIAPQKRERKQMKPEVYRQGDVNLFRCDEQPDENKRQMSRQAKSVVVAHGESGNVHTLTCDREFEVFEIGGETFYAIKEEAKLHHTGRGGDHHGTHTIDPGVYRRAIETEYDPMTERNRKAAD